MATTIETEDKLGLRNNNEVLKLLLKHHKTGIGYSLCCAFTCYTTIIYINQSFYAIK